MNFRMSFLFGPLVTLTAQALTAQEATPTENDDLKETIIVTGQRQSEIDAIRQGVDRIFPSAGPTDPIARFIDPVCLGFAGLNSRQQATFREMLE
jgi:hypothetical protein